MRAPEKLARRRGATEAADVWVRNSCWARDERQRRAWRARQCVWDGKERWRELIEGEIRACTMVDKIVLSYVLHVI